MQRNLACPNCGTPHQIANPGISMIVCSSCSVPIYWGEDEVVHLGQVSRVPPSDARLFMHATGTLGGAGFRVIGHLRYEHERGGWDEWYLELDSGETTWLSEDQRQVTHAQHHPEVPTPPPEQLFVGGSLGIGEHLFTVRELGSARCAGGEGQLPFPVLPGETYPYAELATDDGQHFATLEYDEGDTGNVFLGTVLPDSVLHIEGERDPSYERGPEGKSITCSNCRGALELPPGRDVSLLVCEYCGAQLDLTSSELAVLGTNPKMDPGFQFNVADVCELDRRYEIIGRLLSTDGWSKSRSYLLYSPDAGYRWLTEEDGHFVLMWQTEKGADAALRHGTPKSDVIIGGGEIYKVYESGREEVIYVDGALPYRAVVGDDNYFGIAVKPPKIFVGEWDGDEVEYFEGEYLSPAQVDDAFSVHTVEDERSGVHAAQPYQRSFTFGALAIAGLIFGVVNLGLAGWSVGQKGEPVFRATFAAGETLANKMSEPFALPAGNILALTMSAPVRNNWNYTQLALVSEKEEVVAELEGEVSYYEGYEGGEYWTEGSTTETLYFKAPDPGTYRILAKSEGARVPVTAVIRVGGVLTRYFLIAGGIFLLFPILALVRHVLFENRRWAPVTEDDDDDDWSDYG